MVNLVIDFGNTRTKAAIFHDDKLITMRSDLQIEGISPFISEHQPHHIIVSSVSRSKSDLEKLLDKSTVFLTHKTKLPFKIDYKTPETLGLDRIAAVAGAQYMFPSTNCLVIDTGTCITYDIIDANGTYHGGGISPGINMRFKALNTFTANLPLVSEIENIELIGQSTTESIQSGVIYGILGEIEQIIRMYKDKYANLQIIICGGDANYFENRLKADIFASPELVLTGLNRILHYNV